MASIRLQFAEAIRDLLKAIGFMPIDGLNDAYAKRYSLHKGYSISVDVSAERIEYADPSFCMADQIKVWDGATSNFSQTENLVVLECVNRLLEKGYSPDCIELERVYPSGHGHSGRLDVLVNTDRGQAFLMVECKTWGKEYDKEHRKMLANGGQLFTYFKHATAARHLCLYASRLLGKEVEYLSSIVDVQDEWAALSETKDIYEHWHKVFKKNGIFECYATAYNIVHKRLVHRDLENLRQEDSGKIFHQITSILRHNGVSDKPNAFNKLLNLFVCKIIDEDKNEEDELMFQCWEGMSDEDLQMILNDLYKSGMERFLNIDVIDLTTEDINSIVSRSAGSDKNAEREKLIDYRLKKSPTFAFLEVLDNKTFALNAKIVREIVELLQGYKFRYERKHEFLGNFFELLLNTSMKQEAGQFFTPVPITRFIISSLPTNKLVQGRIDSKSSDPLPSAIDYACGSGHFLTEYMSHLQEIIETVDISKASPSVKNLFSSWRESVKFSWADEYVYGIDFDNRLVKTTKVSAFFNGDGEATVIWGNGLDSFEKSLEYRGKLKCTLPNNKKDNGQFDILISNPPYSVQSFRRMLKHGAESFELFSGLTDNSSEIECLFIERTKQLLRIGGWAGIVLPSSTLTNGGIYSRARDIIFRHFHIRAIVELGSGTFMKTGTNTVVLFLERRKDSECESVMQAIDSFFANRRDVTVFGIEHAFSAFVANAYEGLTFDDYVSFINENANESMRSHDLWKDYVLDFGEEPYRRAFGIEREKMLCFMMTYKQNTVIVKPGQSRQDEKEFLGYEFSERRGQEGIRYLPGGTLLYDENANALNTKKVNAYIHNAYLDGPELEVDESLTKFLTYGRMSGFIEYGTSKFEKRVNLKKRAGMGSPFPLVRLGELVAVVGGLWIGDKPPLRKIHVIRNTDFTLDGRLLVDGIAEIDVEESAFSSRRLECGDILLEKSGGSSTQAVGRVVFFNIADGEYSFSNFTSRLRVVDSRVNSSYLYRVLHYYYAIGGTFPLQKDGKSQLKNLDMDGYAKIRIPVPPMPIQEQIVTLCEKSARAIEGARAEIELLRNGITKRFSEVFGDPVSNPMRWETKALGEMGALKNGLNYGRRDTGYAIKCLGVGDFGNLYKIGDMSGLSEIVLSSEPSSDYLLKNGDILFVRSNGNKTLIGRSVEVFPHDQRITYSGFCIRFRNECPKVLTAYLNHALHYPTLRRALLSDGRGANITNLSQQAIKAVRVPIPPFELQAEFAKYIDAVEESIVGLSLEIKAYESGYMDIFRSVFG